jgi:DNA-binding MarR family transcriptional regulator
MATFRLARRLRSQRAVDTMSDAQFAVLAALSVHGQHTLGELADRERVSAPSMNRTVNGLEESGYLTRTTDADDRRKVNIALTDAGRAVVEETVRRRDSWLEDALAALTASQRELLRSAAELMREVAPMSSPTRASNAMFRSFSVFNYRVWFIGALVSNIGAWMQATALSWVVLTQLTHNDAGAMGVTMALQFAPPLLLVSVTAGSPTASNGDGC